MFRDGDDAAHCSNGFTAQKFKDATAEERITYRRWLRGVIGFYCALLLVAGVVAATSHSGASLQLSSTSMQQAAVSPRTN